MGLSQYPIMTVIKNNAKHPCNAKMPEVIKPNSGDESVFHLEASRELTQSLGGTFRDTTQKFGEKLMGANRGD